MKQALATYRKASKEPGSLPTILLDWQRYLMNIMGKGMLREHNAKQGRERLYCFFFALTRTALQVWSSSF